VTVPLISPDPRSLYSSGAGAGLTLSTFAA